MFVTPVAAMTMIASLRIVRSRGYRLGPLPAVRKAQETTPSDADGRPHSHLAAVTAAVSAMSTRLRFLILAHVVIGLAVGVLTVWLLVLHPSLVDSPALGCVLAVQGFVGIVFSQIGLLANLGQSRNKSLAVQGVGRGCGRRLSWALVRLLYARVALGDVCHRTCCHVADDGSAADGPRLRSPHLRGHTRSAGSTPKAIHHSAFVGPVVCGRLSVVTPRLAVAPSDRRNPDRTCNRPPVGLACSGSEAASAAQHRPDRCGSRRWILCCVYASGHRHPGTFAGRLVACRPVVRISPRAVVRTLSSKESRMRRFTPQRPSG